MHGLTISNGTTQTNKHTRVNTVLNDIEYNAMCRNIENNEKTKCILTEIRNDKIETPTEASVAPRKSPRVEKRWENATNPVARQLVRGRLPRQDPVGQIMA